MEEKTVFIPAISCGHCAAAIRREISGIEGVAAVEVDVASKKARIRWSTPAEWTKIRAALDEIGYPPDE